MGFDCGFDVCPRLEPTPENQETYRRFLDEIIERWQGVYDPGGCREDGKILEMPGEVSEHAKMECGRDQYIYFMVGECPGMPARPENCNFFLRFSSKVSGSLTAQARPYIGAVYLIAKAHFGSERVHFWHEMNEHDLGGPTQNGYYNWTQVYDARKEMRALLAKEREGDVPQVAESLNPGEALAIDGSTKAGDASS